MTVNFTIGEIDRFDLNANTNDGTTTWEIIVPVANATTNAGAISAELTSAANVTPTPDAAASTFTADRTGLTTWVVNFNENIDAVANENTAWTITGGATVTATSDPAGNFDFITLTATGISTTEGGQTVAYVIANGTVVDGEGNALANGGGIAAIDSLVPTHSSVTTSLTTSLVTFSEQISTGTFADANFTAGGAASTNTLDGAAAGQTSMILTFAAVTNSNTVPAILYVPGDLADAAGNLLVAASTGDVDGVAPILLNQTTTNPGTTILMTFDVNITNDSATGTDFLVAGSAGTTNCSGGLAVGGAVLTCTIDGPAILETETVTVQYVKAATVIDDGPALGNEVASFGPIAVVNNVDNTSPTITSVTPTAGSFVPSGFSVGYTNNETLSSGTIVFTRTGGALDGTAHSYPMSGDDLTSGAQSITQATLEGDAGFNVLNDNLIEPLNWKGSSVLCSVSNLLRKPPECPRSSTCSATS